MCELFGSCSKERKQINSYLKEFYSHSSRHPHGWGLACMQDHNVTLEKESLQASKSHYLKERLSQPIRATAALGHIRYATIGHVEYLNCHPYSLKDSSGRRWILTHNGTIFDYPPLSRFQAVQSGSTDSERILLYLVEQMDEKQKLLGRALSAEERFLLLDEIISDMARGNKLNLLICDEEYLYVHTNYANSLYYLEKDGQILFATTPLSEEDWQRVPFTTLLAYRDGRLIRKGTDHQNEYKDSEENQKLLYQIFSDL